MKMESKEKAKDIKQILKKRNYKEISFPIIGLTYLLMYVIVIIGVCGMYSDYSFTTLGGRVNNILRYAFIAAIVYIIPYEKIISLFRYIMDILSLSWDFLESRKNVMKIIGMIAGYTLVVGLCYWYLNEFQFYHWRMDKFSTIIFVLGLGVLIKGTDQIKNQWISAIFAVGFILLNLYTQCVISDKFIYATVIMVVMILIWFINNIQNKKMNILIGLGACLVFLKGFFVTIEAMDRTLSWEGFTKGSTLRSGASVIKQKLQIVGKALPDVHGDYIFTAIYYKMGIFGLFSFGVLFIGFSIAVIYTISRLYKESKNRGGMALGIYLLFLGVLTYCMGQELGILPESTIIPFSNRFNLPLMGLAFRLFDIRKVEERDVSKYEELLGVDEDCDDDSQYDTVLMQIDCLTHHVAEIERIMIDSKLYIPDNENTEEDPYSLGYILEEMEFIEKMFKK